MSWNDDFMNYIGFITNGTGDLNAGKDKTGDDDEYDEDEDDDD